MSKKLVSQAERACSVAVAQCLAEGRELTRVSFLFGAIFIYGED